MTVVQADSNGTGDEDDDDGELEDTKNNATLCMPRAVKRKLEEEPDNFEEGNNKTRDKSRCDCINLTFSPVGAE